MNVSSKQLSKKTEEHMLIVRDKFAHEEFSSQPLRTNNKHFEADIIFLTGCNEIFNVTNKEKNSFFLQY